MKEIDCKIGASGSGGMVGQNEIEVGQMKCRSGVGRGHRRQEAPCQGKDQHFIVELDDDYKICQYTKRSLVRGGSTNWLSKVRGDRIKEEVPVF